MFIIIVTIEIKSLQSEKSLLVNVGSGFESNLSSLINHARYLLNDTRPEDIIFLDVNKTHLSNDIKVYDYLRNKGSLIFVSSISNSINYKEVRNEKEEKYEDKNSIQGQATFGKHYSYDNMKKENDIKPQIHTNIEDTKYKDYENKSANYYSSTLENTNINSSVRYQTNLNNDISASKQYSSKLPEQSPLDKQQSINYNSGVKPPQMQPQNYKNIIGDKSQEYLNNSYYSSNLHEDKSKVNSNMNERDLYEKYSKEINERMSDVPNYSKQEIRPQSVEDIYSNKMNSKITRTDPRPDKQKPLTEEVLSIYQDTGNQNPGKNDNKPRNYTKYDVKVQSNQTIPSNSQNGPNNNYYNSSAGFASYPTNYQNNKPNTAQIVNQNEIPQNFKSINPQEKPNKKEKQETENKPFISYRANNYNNEDLYERYDRIPQQTNNSQSKQVKFDKFENYKPEIENSRTYQTNQAPYSGNNNYQVNQSQPNFYSQFNPKDYHPSQNAKYSSPINLQQKSHK